jgi:hypothetical protein
MPVVNGVILLSGIGVIAPARTEWENDKEPEWRQP